MIGRPRAGSLFFWRDRTHEVDFVVEAGGHGELFEAKWTEVPSESDAVNLEFVCQAMRKSRVRGGGIICERETAFRGRVV